VSAPGLLVVGHYPLDPPDRAPAVRIRAMAEALGRLVPVTLVVGTRAERARQYPALLAEGTLKRVAGVYVEAASSMMTVADWRFLKAVRAAGLPLAVYVRDYYQRFPELYPPRSAKERLMAVGYRATLAAYRRLATTLFVPTEGLGRLVAPGRAELLPPAGSVLTPPPLARRLDQLLYVGANGPHDGVDLAVAAVDRLRSEWPNVRLVLVLRRREAPAELPSFCRLVEASGPALEPWLWSSALGLVPRRDTAYNRIALPVKLFDYLAHGLPVVTTEPGETARWVVTWGVGLAAADSPLAYAQAIARLLRDPALLARMSERALTAVAEEHNWDRRARTVLRALGVAVPADNT
jgi:glycosyltransferase involved in cell wall biosynthesis